MQGKADDKKRFFTSKLKFSVIDVKKFMLYNTQTLRLMWGKDWWWKCVSSCKYKLTCFSLIDVNFVCSKVAKLVLEIQGKADDENSSLLVRISFSVSVWLT